MPVTLENELDNDIYYELLTFNFNQKNGKYELKKILSNAVILGRYEQFRLSNILTSIMEEVMQQIY